MCGIVGFKGENILNNLISSLEKLEYRGYDSSGVAYLENDKLVVKKAVGRITNLKEKLNFKESANLGIAHTRWATHGKVTKSNAHPHKHGSIAIAHNGIIENYLELKEKLINEGVEFYSDTDSEVVAALLNFYYEENRDVESAIKKVFQELVGSYAICLICEDDKDTLYAFKKDSPLVVGKNSNSFFIASDVLAFLEYSNNYYSLDDYEYVKISKDISFFNKDGLEIKKVLRKYDGKSDTLDKENYEHYMLKEIMEQKQVLKDLFEYYQKDNYSKLKENCPDFSKYKEIVIVGCGSAYHAGLVLKNLFEEYLNIRTSVVIASEFRYQKLFLDKDALVIVISQSGETADTLKSLVRVKELGIDTLAIVNSYSSSIARSSDFCLYTRAGFEIAVATTKGYTTQIAIGILIIMYIKKFDIDKTIFKKLENILTNERYLEVAKNIYNSDNIFFLGRGIDYSIAMEGALKLKEISYIHAEAYAAGELKHGTISLIDENSIVFGIITDNTLKEKTISNLKEVESRGAKVILIVREDLGKDIGFCEEKIEVSKTIDLYQTLLAIIPLQLIAYHVAKLKGCDIDKPKNLAKSVTVE